MRVAAALLSIVAAVAAQTTFHVNTHLVQVSAIVHVKNRPLESLTRDDFTITDRGVTQQIAVFGVGGKSNTPAAGPLPVNTFSNRPHLAADRSADGTRNGVTVILLDGMNTLNFSIPEWNSVDNVRTDTLALAFAREQVMKFVKAIEPGDRVAIYSLGRTLKVLCDFTNDSAQLQKILATYRPTPSASGNDSEPLPFTSPALQTANDAVDAGNQQQAALVNGSRASVTIDALRAIAAHVAGIPGRKNLVWLTAAVPLPGPLIARVVSPANMAIYPVDARGLAAQWNRQFNSAMALSQMPMLDVAEQTGGRAFLNNNDLSGAIRQAIDDASVTYTLGFYVDAGSLDGKFHEIKVHVDAPGAGVRYSRGYYASQATPLAQASVDRTIVSPLESAEVHMLARVERIGRPASLSVSGSIDLNNIDLRPDGNAVSGAVELYLIQQNAAGEILDKVRERLAIHLTAGQYAAYLKSGLLFRKVVAARQNVATLRIVAGDPRTAKMGSLIIPVSQLR